jgi:hypothetical protein
MSATLLAVGPALSEPDLPSKTVAGTGHRADIRGGFDGGFVGVDVFFVIFGFVIARSILREIEETGTIRLGPVQRSAADTALAGAFSMANL